MADDVHVTSVEKIGNGAQHAMQVEGVVQGEKTGVLITIPEFEAAEKKGPVAVRELMRESLEAVHQERDARRR